MKHQTDCWIELARKVALLGGEVLKKHVDRIGSLNIKTKSRGDWVSDADRSSEQAIIGFLQNEVPDHAILTEEVGLLKPDKPAPYRWIIDPLDGTTNFLRRFPVWAVSVALEHRPDPQCMWGEIIVGAIYIPPTGELFWAEKGLGAYRDGVRIEIGEGREFGDSLLGTGFPFRTRHLAGQYLKLFSNILPNCADVRRAGAVAVDLCYTAAGIFDGFFELDLAPWDIAAGSLIIREAGGRVANFQGGEDFLTSGDIVAGNPKIFDELVRRVKSYFPQPRLVNKAPTL